MNISSDMKEANRRLAYHQKETRLQKSYLRNTIGLGIGGSAIVGFGIEYSLSGKPLEGAIAAALGGITAISGVIMGKECVEGIEHYSARAAVAQEWIEELQRALPAPHPHAS